MTSALIYDMISYKNLKEVFKVGKNKSNKSSEKKSCIFTGTGKEIENIEFKCSDGHIAVIPIDSLLSEHPELVDCSDNHNISYLTLIYNYKK